MYSQQAKGLVKQPEKESKLGSLSKTGTKHLYNNFKNAKQAIRKLTLAWDTVEQITQKCTYSVDWKKAKDRQCICQQSKVVKNEHRGGTVFSIHECYFTSNLGKIANSGTTFELNAENQTSCNCVSTKQRRKEIGTTETSYLFEWKSGCQ